ncbi:secretin N-terminal domain-containing protein [Duganella sp. Root1480D1]|uniref:secretin N-terminal domain-containing protein n=1 Tax=Duganella sp. Root1480D1 TaxID=1736471 RepID=UPI0009E9E560|nr:secretin N-terminal domain-containing protein [Duganella sp. Root1480D1]
MRKPYPHLARLCAAFFAAVLLAGCGAMQAYRDGNALLAEGKPAQGLARLAEAVKLSPKNAEYRIGLASQRAAATNGLLAAGEAARREGRLSEAEKAYRELQTFDPENAMARQGMESVVMARRHKLVLAEVDALVHKGGSADLTAALDKLRPVLAENPLQREALQLKARVDEARAKDRQAEGKLGPAFRKPISLEFREAPLKSVLEVVAKVSGLNFFYDKDIRPDLKVTVFAKQTTTEDALRVLLVTNQLEQKVLNQNTVLIYPSTQQKQKDYQTLAVRSFFLTNADAKTMANSIKTILKTRDLVVDERLGVIVMRDTPEAIQMAEKLVALHDLADPEVVLDVEIMEVKRSRLMELGIQWPGQLSLAPLQTATTPLTLSRLRGLNSDSIGATVGGFTANARAEDQNGNILANPRIRVRNKEKAKIQIGDRVPVITTTSLATGFVTESVSYVDVGLKLEAEPLIYLDDEVGIKVNLEVSNLVREIISKTGTLTYQIGTRGANTVLRLKDGETQVLAGLISDEDRSSGNKVPLLGQLPIAGRLFGTQKDDTQRSEILLSITPHVVRAVRRPDMLSAEFDSGTEANVGAPSLSLSEVEPAATADGKAPAENAAGAAPAAAPAAAAPAQPAAAGPVGLNFNWQGQPQVKVGEQFTVVLRTTSQHALRGMPLLLGFDPKVLQVAGVQEGDFFRQDKGQTSFNQRLDAAQGKIFAATVRQSQGGKDAGVNGMGTLVAVTFKALRAGDTRVQLLSASPEPAPASLAPLPVEHVLHVVP